MRGGSKKSVKIERIYFLVSNAIVLLAASKNKSAALFAEC
jgi:hypothetical protein